LTAVADASVLIALAKLGLLDLLPALFDDVIIPPAVEREVMARPDSSDALLVVRLIEEGAITVVAPASVIVSALARGEAEVLSLAHEIGNDTIALLDDQAARRIAGRMAIDLLGTVGVLQRAREIGLIVSALEHVLALRAAGFRLSDEVIELVASDERDD
jgi:predicted nucleic acid-binding protein